jgi:hypothetical protein
LQSVNNHFPATPLIEVGEFCYRALKDSDPLRAKARAESDAANRIEMDAA